MSDPKLPAELILSSLEHATTLTLIKSTGFIWGTAHDSVQIIPELFNYALAFKDARHAVAKAVRTERAKLKEEWDYVATVTVWRGEDGRDDRLGRKMRLDLVGLHVNSLDDILERLGMQTEERVPCALYWDIMSSGTAAEMMFGV